MMTPSSNDTVEVFTGIFDQHRQAVHAYLLGRIADPESARDLLQETFLRVWRDLSDVRGLAARRQRAWIFSVARNLTVDTYRRRATRAATDAALRGTVETVASVAEQPEAKAELSDELARLGQAIRNLPEEVRVILTLHSVGELTSVQIGEIVGEPPGTVRYKLSQARRQLAETIGTGSGPLARGRAPADRPARRNAAEE